jgi:hypothetical protein
LVYNPDHYSVLYWQGNDDFMCGHNFKNFISLWGKDFYISLGSTTIFWGSFPFQHSYCQISLHLKHILFLLSFVTLNLSFKISGLCIVVQITVNLRLFLQNFQQHFIHDMSIANEHSCVQQNLFYFCPSCTCDTKHKQLKPGSRHSCIIQLGNS